MAEVGLLIALILLQGSDGGEDGKCPPWHFTPTNATSPCSGCSLPAVADVYCTETSGVIDVTFVMSTRSGSLFLGEVEFELDRTKWLLHGNPVFSELPPNVSELEGFFCNGSDRRGFLCGRCKPGCGISIYTYYGLPCACPCYSYGIPLYILLEIGFSTLFFLVLVVCSFSANSSKWITVILYFELIAHLISSDSSIYTILAKIGPWLPIVIQSLYGFWNMDYLRLVIPKFCVSQRLSVLGALSTGYISAFWPVVLIVLTSLAMHMHKRNFKIVAYPWNFINWASNSLIQRTFSETNLIHTFATYFLLSHLKIVYISVILVAPLNIIRYNGTQDHYLLSQDPYVNYYSREHLFYAVPAVLIFVLIGMLLPVVLVLYPTRCGTWLGNRVPGVRLRNAVKTFTEAMNGSYKDSSAGKRDYRALPGFMLLLRCFIVISCTFRPHRVHEQVFSLIFVAGVLMVLTAFSGLMRPFKTTRHNLYDVSIYSLIAVQGIFLFGIFSSSVYDKAVIHTLAVLIFLPLFVVVVGLLKTLVLKYLKPFLVRLFAFILVTFY